ncbi:kinesin-like protein KIF13B [Nerophis ophidion]|uniref:kinesin-like protein KIF13B n=1 Tax=Nerophis ophidion TaxID=159077 RepID=UPI002ADF20F3|nr:kinesin-like protein KIF13B [Nerophis ophidion]
MPKLLKSLFPARDDKKGLRPSPPSQQHVPRILSPPGGDDGKMKADNTAALLRAPPRDRRSDQSEVPPLPVHDPHDSAPLSPLSQSSSGYFSASVSTATLSDALQPSPSSSSSLLAADAAAAAPPPHRNGVTADDFLSVQTPAQGGPADGGERCRDDAAPDWLTEGVHVTIGSSKAGTVRYVGATQFAEGVWAGVELDSPVGKHDGSVGGRRYFQCRAAHGVMVRPDRLTRRDRNGRRTQDVGAPGHVPVLRGENRKSWSS